MEYIRRTYGVPAKRGGRVDYRGQKGTITGSDGAYLLIRLDGEKRSKRYHPVWCLAYADA